MKNYIPTLQKIMDKAHISPWLHQAVMSTIKALKKKDLTLAYQITACKSLIIDCLEPNDKDHAFQEDQNYNQTQFKGQNIYSLLDGIHHDIAWQLNAMPSGMMAVGVFKGKVIRIKEMKPTGTHPVVKRIKFEHKRRS